MGQQRSVRGDDDDDGSCLIAFYNRLQTRGLFWDLFAHRHNGDAQISARPVVALHENANCIAAELGIEHARRGPDPAFELIAYHSRAATDCAFFDRATGSRIKRAERMLRLDMKSVDVIQPA